MKVKITTDSTCDLSPELIERFDVAVLPLTVVMGDQPYLDGAGITPQDIFEYVKTTGKLPKTSATSIGEYTEFFTELLKEYDAVIHYNISSKASSSHANAAEAAKEFGGRVYVVDSWALSTGQGLLVLKACDLLKEGKTPEEIVRITEELRPLVNTSFVPDSLEYLHKGGRCSLASMIGAKLLKLHPLIEMKEGSLFAKRKLMGNLSVCMKKYISDLAEQYPSYDDTRCFITHSFCPEELVESVKEQVKKLFKFKEILITTAGSVVTTHCGQGTLGLLFIYR